MCQLPLIEDAALVPEDRDVAEERKRVLECQPMIESMVGSPLILQELSKVLLHHWVAEPLFAKNVSRKYSFYISCFSFFVLGL